MKIYLKIFIFKSRNWEIRLFRWLNYWGLLKIQWFVELQIQPSSLIFHFFIITFLTLFVKLFFRDLIRFPLRLCLKSNAVVLWLSVSNSRFSLKWFKIVKNQERDRALLTAVWTTVLLLCWLFGLNLRHLDFPQKNTNQTHKNSCFWFVRFVNSVKC